MSECKIGGTFVKSIKIIAILTLLVILLSGCVIVRM